MIPSFEFIITPRLADDSGVHDFEIIRNVPTSFLETYGKTILRSIVAVLKRDPLTDAGSVFFALGTANWRHSSNWVRVTLDLDTPYVETPHTRR